MLSNLHSGQIMRPLLHRPCVALDEDLLPPSEEHQPVALPLQEGEHLLERRHPPLGAGTVASVLQPGLLEKARACGLRSLFVGFETLRAEALRAQRAALTGLVRDSVISEEIFSELVAEVDEAIMSDSVLWPDLTRNGLAPRMPIKRLMTAIIQESDFEAVNQALHQEGFGVAHLPSTGGFLSRGNVTLLIGLPEGSEEAVVNILKENCFQRVEYIAAPIPEMSGVMPEPISVTVGGATIFMFEVEAWEEF